MPCCCGEILRKHAFITSCVHLIIIRIGAAGNLPDLFVSIVITHKGLISAVHISVEFRIHISAAAPVLIADSEEIDSPWLFVAIFRTKVCHRRYTVVLRWPGGCFADEYHWKDGIGPKESRKKMINTNWGEFGFIIGDVSHLCQ